MAGAMAGGLLTESFGQLEAVAGEVIRAAMDALNDFGRPNKIQLAVLIDRGHRELPIEATYIGRRVPTSSREIIEVKFQEVDNDEQVLLVERVD